MTVRTTYIYALPKWEVFWKRSFYAQTRQTSPVNWTHERESGTVVTYEMQVSSGYKQDHYYFRDAPIFAPEKMLNRYIQLWCEYYGN